MPAQMRFELQSGGAGSFTWQILGLTTAKQLPSQFQGQLRLLTSQASPIPSGARPKQPTRQPTSPSRRWWCQQKTPWEGLGAGLAVMMIYECLCP